MTAVTGLLMVIVINLHKLTVAVSAYTVYKTNITLDPGMLDAWIDPQNSAGYISARHSGKISTLFADGHSKLIMTPIANSHTNDNNVNWTNPATYDRTDLN